MYRDHHQAPSTRDHWNQEAGPGRIPQYHGQSRFYDPKQSSYSRRGRRNDNFNGRVENFDGRRNDWNNYRPRGPPRAISPVRTNPADSDRIDQRNRFSEFQRGPNYAFDRNQGENRRQNEDGRENEDRRQNDERRLPDDRRPLPHRDQQTSKPGENPYHKERYYLSNRLPTGQFIDKRSGPANGERRQSTNDEGPRPQVTVAEGDINRCPLLSTLPPAKEVVNNHIILPFANYGTETGRGNQDDGSSGVFMPDPNSDDEELRAAMDMKMEVLEFHYREREAQSNGTANGNGLINQNNSSSSNIPQQLRLEKTQGNSTNSTKKNNSNSKDREKQNSTTNSRRKEPVAISASQLPVYSVKSATAKHPNNSEAESSAQPANKRKKKISDKAVEDEFEFPLAKRKPVKREPAVENEESENVPRTSNENIPNRYESHENNQDSPTPDSVPNGLANDIPRSTQRNVFIEKQILRTRYEEIRQKMIDTETQMQTILDQYFRLQEDLYIKQNELDRVVYDLFNLDNS